MRLCEEKDIAEGMEEWMVSVERLGNDYAANSQSQMLFIPRGKFTW